MNLYDDINYWVAKCAHLQQEIDVLNEKLANASVIKWQTGEPKEGGYYLTTMDCGDVHVNFWKILPNCAYWLQCNPNRVIAWCKLSDIKPYYKEDLE